MQGAQQRGLDQKLIDRLVRSEGGYSTFDRTGDSGRSFGPFQDYTGGGLGNTMRAQGLEPSDPRLETQNIDWNLNYIQQHGASPDVWHGLRRSGSGGEKLQPEGYYDSSLHVNVRPTDDNNLSEVGALFLSGLLKNAYPEEAKQPTGNSLLDGLIKASMPGNEPPPAQQHPPQEFIEPPAAPLPPATVPELQPQGLPPASPQPQPKPQVPTAPMPTPPAAPMPMQAAASPASAVPASSAPQPSLNPLNLLINQAHAETAGAPAAPAPQPAQPPAPTPPPGNTGNGLLDTLLKRASLLPFAGPAIGAARVLAQPAEIEQASGDLHAAAEGLGLPTIEEQEKSDAEFHRRFAEGQPLSQIAREMELPPIAGAVGTEPMGPARGLPAPRGEAGLPVPRVTPGAELPSPGVAGRSLAVPGRELVPQPEAGGGAGGAGQPPVWRGGGAETAPERPGRSKNEGESREVRNMRLQAMHSTQDKLFRLWTQSNAYVNKLLRQFKDMPQLSAEEKLQAERYLEWQPGMPQVAINGKTRRVVDQVIKPAQRQAAKDWAYLKSKGAVEHLSDDIADELSEGYLHRMRAPLGKERHPLEPFAGVRNLRRSTSSQKQRKFYVVQDVRGNRTVYRGDAPPPNSALHDAYGTKIGEVRRATTEEIERETDTRYVHDPIMASLQNMAQLHLARKNVELLTKDILPDLREQGLSVTDAKAARRLGFRETEIPALRGNYFEKRLADGFNDFHRTPSLLHEDMQGALGLFGKINRIAINTLFLNPFGHIRNVIGDALLARGSLWADRMAEPNFPHNMKAAFKDVTTRSPLYYRVMNHGGSTMGAGFESSILYRTLVDRVRDEMTRLPHMEQIARETGVWKSAKDMGQAIWEGSQKFMWGFHDMLLMQAVRERLARGMPMDRAISEAERFIADYRVPATIGEGGKVINLPYPVARAMSRLMQDRTITVFGRYHFNKLKAIGNVVRDASRAMSRSGMPAPQRMEALGRLGAMLVWSSILQYGLTWALQAATGNPRARVTTPGAMGIPANVMRMAGDVMKGELGQAGYDFWMGLMSIVTPMPAVLEVMDQMSNRPYPFSGGTITNRNEPPGISLIKRGIHAGKTFLPPVGDIMDPRRLLSSTTGISIPPPPQ